MSLTKTKKFKHLIFLLIIAVLLIVGRFFYFWVAYPLIIGIVIFYSIQFYSNKSYLLYPALLLGTLLVSFGIGEAYVMYATNTGSKMYYSVKEDLGEFTFPSKEEQAFLEEDSASMQVNKRRSARFDIRDGSAVYDAIYSTDLHGRRVTPNYEETAKTAIVLLGCSFTHGTGLNDNETFAWRLAQKLGSEFQVYNYGRSGSGSHHMLETLESNRLDELKGKFQNVYAYYLTFPGIELRSAGLSSWDKDGPWYVLENGNVKYAGILSDASNYKIHLRGKFSQSVLLQKIVELTSSHVNKTNDEMLALDAAIVAKSEEVFTEKFTDSKFTAVLYTDFDGLEIRLKEKSVPILELRPYFPVDPLFHEDYILGELDKHPNAKAADVVSEAIYDNIQELMSNKNK